jgi:hypothetical protein
MPDMARGALDGPLSTYPGLIQSLFIPVIDKPTKPP